MLTAGDIEFEPASSKVLSFGSHCTALIAGNASDHNAIYQATRAELAGQPKALISEVAEIYARNFAEYRFLKAERQVLSPLGLDREQFLEHQATLASELVLQIAEGLADCKLDIETIITGVDSAGAHIYVIRDPGVAEYSNSVGFAAIGIGQWHALSQFMFARFTARESVERTMLLMFYAKRRAEVAPSVGSATDMFSIGPEPAGYEAIDPQVWGLEPLYDEIREAETAAFERAYTRLAERVSPPKAATEGAKTP
jgi:hypothetical protein